MSSVQLRRLSQELVRLRKERKLTVADVTEAMEWSAGRLTYYELAKWKKADIGTVTRLLDYYGVHEDDREALLHLARETKAKGWWAAYKDIFPASYPAFEDAATLIRAYESNVMPGLLQTPDYVKAIMLGAEPDSPGIIERKIEARLARQQILRRADAPEFWCVIDEAAFHRMVGGPEVMRAQIRHLIEMAAWPRITIQLLPNTVGAHAAIAGAFCILDFASQTDPPLVYLEAAVSSLFLENPADVQKYTIIFSRIIESALTSEESLSRMAELQDQLK
ncbi:XRE family transcriptional regulator [Sphaerisporangium album]|uniref:XRE family transcriptional regulator n=1 Tax=Sphaerisporangium album TaxID=509200 RepID=A0A367FQY5_9ACTN|nr:helix-turn-helix transcriptional regulator [Sphaerisporangium album]RCG32025.1 XRE family transcriptional regulator [Sphaerisporangium album]